MSLASLKSMNLLKTSEKTAPTIAYVMTIAKLKNILSYSIFYPSCLNSFQCKEFSKLYRFKYCKLSKLQGKYRLQELI